MAWSDDHEGMRPKPTTNLFLEHIDGRRWRVHHPFDTRQGWIVPSGFETNFAWVFFVWRLMSSDVLWSPASVLHDYFYRTPSIFIPRKAADQIFLVMLKRDGVPLLNRTIAYLAVRLMGWRHWKKRP